jgi:hypothetical protein
LDEPPESEISARLDFSEDEAADEKPGQDEEQDSPAHRFSNE